MEYVLMIILLVAAIFLVGAVLLQKTKDDGLSSTIAGGTETYYGKDKGARTDKLLKKLTLTIGLVFALAVLVIYIIQPDYTYTLAADTWKSLTSYSELFN